MCRSNSPAAVRSRSGSPNSDAELHIDAGSERYCYEISVNKIEFYSGNISDLDPTLPAPRNPVRVPTVALAPAHQTPIAAAPVPAVHHPHAPVADPINHAVVPDTPTEVVLDQLPPIAPPAQEVHRQRQMLRVNPEVAPVEVDLRNPQHPQQSLVPMTTKDHPLQITEVPKSVAGMRSVIRVAKLMCR